MNLRESIGIALGSIRANKLRSFLTLLGTIIGVASVIAVVSFVEGMNRYVTNKLLNAGANVFWVDKYGFVTTQEAFEDAQRRPDVTIEDAEALQAGMTRAAMVVPEVGSSANLRYRNRVLRGISLQGKGIGYEVVNDLVIESGRHLAPIDDERRRDVCVIGPEVAEEMFANLDPLGRRIRVGEREFEVIGVTKAKGKIFGQSQDRFVIVPIRTFQKHWMERGSLTLNVKSVDAASIDAAQQEARNILRARRHQRPGQPDAFGISTAETYLELYRTLTGGIFIVTIGVAAISLVVGGIVIMNIMLVSVTERTREIGVRKALGAPRRAILLQFLIEAVLLTAAGGLIGVLLGAGVSGLVKALSPLPTYVSMWSVMLGLGFSAVVGVFFGLYPAMRASRLDPVDSLRYE